MDKNIAKSVRQLVDLIQKGTSPYHVVRAAGAQLEEAGFQELQWNEIWKLQKGGAYYISPFQTTLLAFRVQEEFRPEHQLRIISSHVDAPGLRIKAKAEYPYKNYQRLNAEVYGGAINHTWMDRPLGMAGIVALKGVDGLRPRICYLDCKRPLFIAPNVSIHMNRELNKGSELNPQVDLIPLAGMAEVMEEAYFTQFLAAEITKAEGLEVKKEEIISYDLCLYNMQEGCICGMNEELLAAPRLDNLTSVQASLTALINSSRNEGLDVIALFDHEEIGSRSKNGGAGNLLPFTLERIYQALEMSRGDYLRSVGNGFLISADAAHGLNPNHPEKYDPTSFVQLGDGVAIKCASKQNYAGDGETWAVLKALGEAHNIPCGFTYIRSDTPGGSTLGSILSAALPMRSADIGVPLLAMHSAVETMCCRDQHSLEQYLKAFLSQDML